MTVGCEHKMDCSYRGRGTSKSVARPYELVELLAKLHRELEEAEKTFDAATREVDSARAAFNAALRDQDLAHTLRDNCRDALLSAVTRAPELTDKAKRDELIASLQRKLGESLRG